MKKSPFLSTQSRKQPGILYTSIKSLWICSTDYIPLWKTFISLIRGLLSFIWGLLSFMWVTVIAFIFFCHAYFHVFSRSQELITTLQCFMVISDTVWPWSVHPILASTLLPSQLLHYNLSTHYLTVSYLLPYTNYHTISYCYCRTVLYLVHIMWLPFPNSEENQKTLSKLIAILFYNPTMVSAFAEGYYHTGILCIPWSEFDGIYLSWDPQRWTKVLVFHEFSGWNLFHWFQMYRFV